MYQRMRALLSEIDLTDGEWNIAPGRNGPPQS